MSLPYADVASAPRKDVVFECGHSAWIAAGEYGDGSAWCLICGDFQCYDVAAALVSNMCAECDYADCGPGSVCAFCGHCDWRESDE